MESTHSIYGVRVIHVLILYCSILDCINIIFYYIITAGFITARVATKSPDTSVSTSTVYTIKQAATGAVQIWSVRIAKRTSLVMLARSDFRRLLGAVFGTSWERVGPSWTAQKYLQEALQQPKRNLREKPLASPIFLTKNVIMGPTLPSKAGIGERVAFGLSWVRLGSVLVVLDGPEVPLGVAPRDEAQPKWKVPISVAHFSPKTCPTFDQLSQQDGIQMDKNRSQNF